MVMGKKPKFILLTNKRVDKKQSCWNFKGKESLGRSSITAQNAGPFQEGLFHPSVWFTQVSTAEEKLPSPAEAVSMGFIFQLKHRPCSNPSYTQRQSTVDVQEFTGCNCVRPKTCTRKLFPYMWGHQLDSLQQEKRGLSGKRDHCRKNTASFQLAVDITRVFQA